MSKVWTFTFSESVENHKGMQILGNIADQGFTDSELQNLYKKYKDSGFETELVVLYGNFPESVRGSVGNPVVLVIRNALRSILD